MVHETRALGTGSGRFAEQSGRRKTEDGITGRILEEKYPQSTKIMALQHTKAIN